MQDLDIRHWRHVNRVKQEALAEMLGVSRVAVSKWESGQSRPSKAAALRLADIMGGIHNGQLAAEAMFLAPQQQIKALFRGKSMQLVGVSAGFSAAWPEMFTLVGDKMRKHLTGEAQLYADGSDLLREATAGELLMVSGVSNRFVNIGDVPDDTVRLRWHAIIRHIDGELVHELIYEPCDPATPTGFERLVRRSDITLNTN
jgi:transcriptional regulator with XRE-family HTH domain